MSCADGGDVLEDGGDVLENVGDAAEGGGDVVEDGCDDVEDLLLLATSRLMRGLTGPWGGHARLAKLPSPLKLMPCSKLQKSNFDRMLTKIRFQPILFIWVLKGSVIEKNTHLFC